MEEAVKRKIELIISQINSLPPLPDNVIRITEMLNQPGVTAADVGEEIAKDQSLSAQVMTLINSGFHGLARNVSSLSHATVMLGFNAMRSVVLTSVLASKIESALPDLFSHSLACAKCAYYLGTKFGAKDPEMLRTIGLVHDIGKVVIAEHLPDEFREITRLTKAGLTFYMAEYKVMGISHSEVGAMMLKHWRLPADIIEPVKYHHHFTTDLPFPKETAIINLANVLVQAECYGWSGNVRIPAVNKNALAYLNIELCHLEELMNGMVDELYDIPRHFDSHA